MKSSHDPRHQQRIEKMQHLFSSSFDAGNEIVDEAITPIFAVGKAIDEKIHIAAPEWPIEKIAKIDLAILRLAVYELTVDKKEPSKVVIDEAIELAKEFGNPNSPQFINGVLGTIFKNL
jgi:transcription antitermination protein NusB